jgi:signal transduction histidine kinase
VGVGDISPDLLSSNSRILKIDIESGKIIKARKLFMPPVLLRDWSEGIAALCFKVHLVLLNYELDMLSIDHSSIFPTAFLALDMNYDGTKDLIAAGERYCKLPDYFQDNLSKYFGITFGRVPIASNFVADIRFAVDCYVNRYNVLHEQALSEISTSQIMIDSKNFVEAATHLARARGLFATLKDPARVAALSGMLKNLHGTETFRSRMPFILPLYFFIGAALALYPLFLPLVRMIIGMLLLNVPVYAIHVLGPVKYYPMAAYSTGFIAAFAISYFYASVITSEAADIYRSLQLSRESFTHGGGGSRILDSLKLLLGNAPGMRERIDEYIDILGKRITAYRDTCIPQLYELDAQLKLVSAGSLRNLRLRELIKQSDDSLSRLLDAEEDIIQESKEAYESISRCREELSRIFDLLKRFPACDVASVAKRVWNTISFAGKDDFLFNLSKKGTSPVAFFPELELAFILENLYSNAARNLESVKDPTITIKVYRRFSHVFIRYEDNGPGFSPEKIKEITASVRDSEGHGRGLSLSMEKLARYGASMNIRPSNNGAVITMKLLEFGSRRSKSHVKAYNLDR